jgi:hypothetical protein
VGLLVESFDRDLMMVVVVVHSVFVVVQYVLVMLREFLLLAVAVDHVAFVVD